MEQNTDKSQVWLVSRENTLGNSFNTKVKKQMLFDYPIGDKADGHEETIYWPAGYIIKHPKGKSNSYEEFDGFGTQMQHIATPIVTGVDISHLEGELLTILDAAIPDKEQQKAVKDLLKSTLWRFNHRLEKRTVAMFESAQE